MWTCLHAHNDCTHAQVYTCNICTCTIHAKDTRISAWKACPHRHTNGCTHKHQDPCTPSHFPAWCFSPSAFSSTPPRSHKQYHHLLYHGSLSLPDSDLVLEGIILTAHLQPTSSASLLELPLALALESMCGFPSSCLVFIMNVSDIHYECTGDISMYIHPCSVLARSFFENVLCTDKVDASDHTLTVIHIGLGYGHGPDEPDLLAFGSLLPSQSTLRMTVAWVTTHTCLCMPPQSRSMHSPILKAHIHLYMTYVPHLPCDLVRPTSFQGPLRMAMPCRILPHAGPNMPQSLCCPYLMTEHGSTLRTLCHM